MNTFKVLNPYDQSLVGEFEYDSMEKIQKIIEDLPKDKRKLQKISASERSGILAKLSKLIKKRENELARIITLEMGKTISDSLVEVERSRLTCLCASEEARHITGEVLDSDSYGPKRGKMGIVRKKPIGAVLAITPFNFPINLSVHKIAPAFASGNVVIFKPGPQNYYSAKILVELCYEAGIPEYALKLVMPDIFELTHLIQSDAIQCISFTGGTKTADAIAKNAGRKKLLLELGGNDPLIVMPDADLNLAVSTAINQRFGTAGQRCTASKRLFIHQDIYTKFKTLLVEKAKNLVIGDPLNTETFVGPLVNIEAAKIVEKRINDAINDGATLLLGGKREGALITPTILENVNLSSELICDETFGPVIPLLKFENIDEIIPIINSTPFGLQSGVFTYDMRIIKRLFDELDVGALAVNDGPGFRAEHFPFGGVKNSGLGREGVRYAMEEMMVLKTLIM